MMNDRWVVQAYTFKGGYYQLAEFASGLSHRHAADSFKRWHDTNKFAKLEMTQLPKE
jgi:hypothetical protein